MVVEQVLRAVMLELESSPAAGSHVAGCSGRFSEAAPECSGGDNLAKIKTTLLSRAVIVVVNLDHLYSRFEIVIQFSEV